MLAAGAQGHVAAAAAVGAVAQGVVLDDGGRRRRLGDVGGCLETVRMAVETVVKVTK